MTLKADGTYDGAGWFLEGPMPYSQWRNVFLRWGRRINARRAELVEAYNIVVPMLNLSLFRPHSIRHGAALNFKRLGMDMDYAAVQLNMSKDVLTRIYGIEDATSIGDEWAPQVVGSASLGIPALISAIHEDIGSTVSTVTIQFIMQQLEVDSVLALGRVPSDRVVRTADALYHCNIDRSIVFAIHRAAKATVSDFEHRTS